VTNLPIPAERTALPRKLDADLTVRRMVPGPLEAVVNAFLTLAAKLGLGLTRMEVDSVLNEALRRTRPLTDFGDPQFMGALTKLMESLDQAEWTHMGRVLVRGLVRRALQHRLKIAQWFKDHPEVFEVPIERPIFVLGFPRTGTTLLQNLLSCAPQRRALQFWELSDPTPRHKDLQTDRRRRMRQITFDLWAAYKVVPELPKLHHSTPTSPEEDWSLFINTINVLNFDLSHGLTDFGDWLLEQDLTWAYREFRTFLQILLARIPAEQLVLKCPEHLWFLDNLLAVFPDACIVMTHREPTDCIASYCSMVSLNRRSMAGRIDPVPLGRHITKRFREGMDRAMAARDQACAERFLDIDFYDLVGDPVATVHRIEEHFGLKQTDSALLQDWLDTKRHDTRGAHKYSAELYGLEPKRVHEELAAYIERFNVRLTPPDQTG
jgi:hypothetical protein